MKKEEKVRSLKPLIESALFMTSDVISVHRLSRMFKTSPNFIQRVIDDLKKQYDDPNHGIHIFETSQT